jgi:hypothetical protein
MTCSRVTPQGLLSVTDDPAAALRYPPICWLPTLLTSTFRAAHMKRSLEPCSYERGGWCSRPRHAAETSTTAFRVGALVLDPELVEEDSPLRMELVAAGSCG